MYVMCLILRSKNIKGNHTHSRSNQNIPQIDNYILIQQNIVPFITLDNKMFLFLHTKALTTLYKLIYYSTNNKNQ